MKKRGGAILVVDDDRDTRKLLETFLSRRGFRVMSAENGLQLVRMLKVHQPDLVLMDVSLSWVDGFELCRLMKNKKEWSRISIAFLTSLPMEEMRERAFSCGGEDVFKKPIDTEILMLGIQRILNIPAS